MTDTYHIWFDLKQTAQDLEFCEHLDDFLGQLASQGTIRGWNLQRRKLGFGPPELGEFWLRIDVEDLAQLDRAFGSVAPRTGEMEKAHARIWSRVTNFKAGLWRDFPDDVRVRD